MFKHLGKAGIAVALVLGLGACDVEDSSPYDEPLGDWVGEDGRIAMRNAVENASATNGVVVNGIRCNGLRVNGLRVNGLRVNGLRVNGSALNSPQMNGNKLQAKNASNQVLEGQDLEDLRLDMDHEDPNDQSITQIEQSVTEVEVAANGLVLNTLKFRELPAGTWQNSCENGAKAIQLKGDWDVNTGERISDDPSSSTWACLGGALGDCASWGYIPGNSYAGAALANYHQTCIRLKRADYCGNGTHHTQNGHPLDVYDKVSMMAPEASLAWNIEGFWGPNGALCLNHTRKTNYSKYTNDGSKTYIGCNIPACVDVNSDGQINFADYPTALMANKSVPMDPV